MRRRRSRGATTFELSLAIVLIAMLAVFGSMAFGKQLSSFYTSVARKIGLVDNAPDEDADARSTNPTLTHASAAPVGGPSARNLRDLAKGAYDARGGVNW